MSKDRSIGRSHRFLLPEEADSGSSVVLIILADRSKLPVLQQPHVLAVSSLFKTRSVNVFRSYVLPNDTATLAGDYPPGSDASDPTDFVFVAPTPGAAEQLRIEREIRSTAAAGQPGLEPAPPHPSVDDHSPKGRAHAWRDIVPSGEGLLDTLVSARLLDAGNALPLRPDAVRTPVNALRAPEGDGSAGGVEGRSHRFCARDNADAVVRALPRQSKVLLVSDDSHAGTLPSDDIRTIVLGLLAEIEAEVRDEGRPAEIPRLAQAALMCPKCVIIWAAETEARARQMRDEACDQFPGLC